MLRGEAATLTMAILTLTNTPVFLLTTAGARRHVTGRGGGGGVTRTGLSTRRGGAVPGALSRGRGRGRDQPESSPNPIPNSDPDSDPYP